MKKDKKYGLADAYSLKTPDDNKELYRDWASTYDEDFAQERGYQYPARLADVYAEYSRDEDVPILDVGAGTGLVAQVIRSKGLDFEIDAIDISTEMLEQSRSKSLYKNHIQADLTQTLPMEAEHYGAFLSSGTFTQGHVGPEALEELLRVARPKALFCLGINARVFDEYGFGSAFAILQADKKITTTEFIKIPYYQAAKDKHPEDDHSNDDYSKDYGLTAVFRKA